MNIDDIKAQAKRLGAHLAARHGLTLRHAALLEAVAAQLGYKNWSTLAGVANPGTPRNPVGAPPAGDTGALTAAALRRHVLLTHCAESDAFEHVVSLLQRHTGQGGRFIWVGPSTEGTACAAWLQGRGSPVLSHDVADLISLGLSDTGRCNLFLAGTPPALNSDRIMQLLPPAVNAGAQYYRSACRSILEPVLLAMRASGCAGSLQALAWFLEDGLALDALERSLHPGGLERTKLAAALAPYRDGAGQVNRVRLLQDTGGLAQRIHHLAAGARGAVFGAAEPTVDIAERMLTGKSLVIGVPPKDGAVRVDVLANVLLDCIFAGVEARPGEGTDQEPPMLLVLEHLMDACSPGVEALLARARSRGVGVVVVEPVREAGELALDSLRRARDNCGTHVQLCGRPLSPRRHTTELTG